MITKVLAVVLVTAFVIAVEDVPTSYVTYDNYHNEVKHIQSRHDTIGKAAPLQYSSQGQSGPYNYRPPVKSTGYSVYSGSSQGLSSHASAPSVSSIRYTSSPIATQNLGQYSAPSASPGIQYASPQAQYSSPHYTAQYSAPQPQYSVPRHIAQYSAPQYTTQYVAPAAHSQQYSVPSSSQSVHYGAQASQEAQYSSGAGSYSNQHGEENAHPKYEFSYGVEDPHSGDIHSHKETRDGDQTQGEYSLQEADGTVRTVKYSVDKHSGFNAIVERTKHNSHPQQGHQGQRY